MLRIGRIDYVNCDPLFVGLAPGPGREITAAVPSELNRRMRCGLLDLSAISSIEYARGGELYGRVPGVGISAGGPIQSVLLLSPEPVTALAGQTVHLCSESATTVVLLKILMHHRFRVEPRYESWDLAGGLPPGPVMIIGDPALAARATPSHGYVYDLADEWVRMTGLPMTFALVCFRREAERQQSQEIQRLSRLFQLNARRWPEDLEAVAAPAAARMRLPLPLVRAYLLGLQFRFEERHAAGLALYFRMARGLGELENTPELTQDSADDSELTREG